MRFLGHFLHKLSNGPSFLNTIYSFMHLILMLLQFIGIVVNLALNTSEVNELTANTVTALHFTHTITKFSYLAINNKHFYRTFNIWNQSNSHPLFAESDARYHSIALAKMRKSLYMITGLTLATVICKLITEIFHYHLASKNCLSNRKKLLSFFSLSITNSLECHHILRWKC